MEANACLSGLVLCISHSWVVWVPGASSSRRFGGPPDNKSQQYCSNFPGPCGWTLNLVLLVSSHAAADMFCCLWAVPHMRMLHALDPAYFKPVVLPSPKKDPHSPMVPRCFLTVAAGRKLWRAFCIIVCPEMQSQILFVWLLDFLILAVGCPSFLDLIFIFFLLFSSFYIIVWG